MASSTQPAFRAALYARLVANTSLGAAATPIQISVGHPYPETVERETIIIRDTRAGTTLAQARGYSGEADVFLGDGHRQEDYVTEVVVSCVTAIRNDQLTLETRAWELAEYVTTSIRAWLAEAWAGITVPTGAQFCWCRLNTRELTQHLDPESKSREARVSLAIACNARL